MPLIKDVIKGAIVSALTQAAKIEDDPAAARELIASIIADGIDQYTKGADVNPGIAVSTTGSATAHTGVTTSKGTLS